MKVTHAVRQRKEATRSRKELTLDIALLTASMNVDESERGAAVALHRFDRDYVLIVLRANFQLSDRTGVVAFALESFGFFVIVVVEIGVRAGMFVGVALKHFAVCLKFFAVEVDDLGGSVVGIIFRNHQLYAKGTGEEAWGLAALLFSSSCRFRAPG